MARPKKTSSSSTLKIEDVVKVIKNIMDESNKDKRVFLEEDESDKDWIVLENISEIKQDGSPISQIRFPKEQFFQKMFNDIRELQSQLNDVTKNLLDMNPILVDINKILPEIKLVIQRTEDMQQTVQLHGDEIEDIKQKIPKSFWTQLKDKAEISNNFWAIIKFIVTIIFIISILFSAFPTLTNILKIILGYRVQ